MTKTTFDIPKCFNKEQWEEWKSAAYNCNPVDQCSICDDCTVEYMLEMTLQERCEYSEWKLVQFIPRKKFREI